MTRKWFLGLLGIGAAGQEIQESHPIYTIPRYTVEHHPYKPKNGECPVCGTMAPRYELSKAAGMYYDKFLGAWVDSEITAHYHTRTISCTHCRVIFAQDAEYAK